MAQIRIRIELQRATAGIELAKLQDLAKEANKFLRMVAEDVRVDSDEGTWTAKNFYNQGIGFDCEYELIDVDGAQAAEYRHAVERIATVEAADNFAVRGVRPATLVQSAKMASIAGEGETIRVGIVGREEHEPVAWKPIPRNRAVQIIEYFQQWVEYRGMLQGLIHSLYKEANPPYFDLRDFASRELVKCFYQPVDYDAVYRALERKDGVVLVSGWFRTRRVDRMIDHVNVERIQPTKPLNEEQLKKFFGSAPGWTGDLTSDQFIDAIRQQGDDGDG